MMGPHNSKDHVVDGNGNDNNYDESMENHNSFHEVYQNMWETSCRLLKGAYYAQEGMDLNRLHHETYHDYAIHAAVGLTSFQRPSGSPWLLLNGLIERLVQHYPLELQKVDPQTGRLPLHVVLAATKYRPDRLPILETLLAVYPKAAAIPTVTAVVLNNSCDDGKTNDGRGTNRSSSSSSSSAGIYPLQLACQSGYPWKGACQDLYKAAPHIATEMLQQQQQQHHCPIHCPPELRAIQSKASLVLEQELQEVSIQSKASLVVLERDDPSWYTAHSSPVSPSSLSLSSTSTSATPSPLPQRHPQNDVDADDVYRESHLSSLILNIRGSRGDDAQEDLLLA
jgi:hypothetical protein